MTFFENDIYTGSGSVALYHCWTENVTKHDTSSFYNWEQDNEPLHDLEERTYLLWEQLGYPASTVPGLSLVVSADAPASSVGCNSNIFADLSSCINSLPKIIRFPILVEVIGFGSIGELNLDGFETEDRGSLEIINRGFARGLSYQASGDGGGNWEQLNQYNTLGAFNSGGNYDSYEYISEVILSDTSVSSAPYDGGPVSELINASALSISSLMLSGATAADRINDARLTSNVTMIFDPVFYTDNGSAYYEENNRLTVFVDDDFSETSGATAIDGSPYEEDGATTEVFDGFDSSSFDNITGSEIIRDFPDAAAGQPLNGRYYTNSLSRMTITDCVGEIYVRNFLVNGNRSEQDGITVTDSDVILENTASILNNGNGFLITNSRVAFTRGLVAYRNYKMDGADRLTGDWSALPYNEAELEDDTAGLKAVNSDLILSSTSAFEFGVRSDTSAVWDINFLINFSRNTNGVLLDNSILRGGAKQTSNFTTAGNGQGDAVAKMYLKTEYSTNAGLLAVNSKVDYKGRVDVLGNMVGIHGKNSTIKLDEFTIQSSQRQAILAENTSLIYNQSLVRNDISTAVASVGYHHFNLSGNGTHIEARDGASVKPQFGAGMDDLYGQMVMANPHGTNASRNVTGFNSVPAIKATDNSVVELVNLKATRASTEFASSYRGVKGAIAFADRNSEVLFRGTRDVATRIIGSNLRATQKFVAGVAANSGSTVKFMGPTVIAQFGVGALAENNSVIEFAPHERDGNLDISSFTLSDQGNHTHVEIHSSRACLVASKNSVISVKNLGDYIIPWTESTAGSALLLDGRDYDTSTNGLNIIDYIKAGSLQFYPNSNDDEDYESNGIGIDDVTTFNTDIAFTPKALHTDVSGYQYLIKSGGTGPWDSPRTVSDLSALTSGGVCVKAVGNSHVEMQNVHFPTGWWNPSGIYYDSSSGELCDRLFIWNIADESTLKVTYASVSALAPLEAGYFGPSSVWEEAGGGAAYNAPSSTPFTSSLSVLDYYGTGPTGNILPTLPNGSLTAPFGGGADSNNLGPFRLFMGVDGAADLLELDGVASSGLPTQLFAQGYSASSNLSSINTAASSTYHSLVKMDDAGALATSGFYTPEEMMANSSKAQVLLSDDCMDLFANAKHLAVGKSNIPKVVNILQTFTNATGHSALNAYKSFGRGFKSPSIFDLYRED